MNSISRWLRRAWPRMPFSVRAAVMAVLLAGGSLMVAPGAAQAEPHTYRMECHDYMLSGTTFGIDDPNLCKGGVIWFYDVSDNHIVGKFDVFKMKEVTGPDTTLQDAYDACTKNVYCQIGVAAVDTLILSKVKLVWLGLKALI